MTLTLANDSRLGSDIPIHGPPMSSLNTLEENAPVLLRITGSHHKSPRSRMQFCAKRDKGPGISSLNLYIMVSKFRSVECLICCFSDE